MNKNSLTHILFIGFLFISLCTYGTGPIKHRLLGGSYVFESHFNSNLHGVELSFYRHLSHCTHSDYLNSFNANILFGNNFKEIGVSYTDGILKINPYSGFLNWSFIYKINPNIVTGLGNEFFLLKPGIGISLNTNARGFVTFQAFILYNYDLYLNEVNGFNQMNKHSVQLSVFIGFNAFKKKSF